MVTRPRACGRQDEMPADRCSENENLLLAPAAGAAIATAMAVTPAAATTPVAVVTASIRRER